MESIHFPFLEIKSFWMKNLYCIKLTRQTDSLIWITYRASSSENVISSSAAKGSWQCGYLKFVFGYICGLGGTAGNETASYGISLSTPRWACLYNNCQSSFVYFHMWQISFLLSRLDYSVWKSLINQQPVCCHPFHCWNWRSVFVGPIQHPPVLQQVWPDSLCWDTHWWGWKTRVETRSITGALCSFLENVNYFSYSACLSGFCKLHLELKGTT